MVWVPLFLTGTSVLSEGFTEEVTFEQRLEGGKEKLMCVSGVVENGTYIGPQGWSVLVYLRKSKEASMAKTD